MPHILRADKLVGIWEVPLRGMIRNLPIANIPPDAIYDGLNVVVKGGRLRPRPGLELFTATEMIGRPTGAFNTMNQASPAFQSDAFQSDAFQVSATIPGTSLFIGTTRKIYVYLGGVLSEVGGLPSLTALESQLARFTSIMFGTPPVLYTLHTNGADVMRQHDATSGVFSPVAGSPPLFTDITTISDHIIGIVPPFDVRWSNTLSLASWPALNSRVLADTADPVVAIRNLGTQGGVVYKTRSLWAIEVVGGTEASYFRVNLKGLFDGPCSPAAVVEADGAHYYMTDEGRVAYFDGSSFEWVADGVWPVIESQLDPTFIRHVFGVFYPAQRQIWFVYPRLGEGGNGQGVCIVQLPKPWEGIESHIAWLGELGFAVSAGADLKLDLKESLLCSITTPKVYKITDDADDAGTPITGHWQTGLVMAPGGEIFAVDAYETFALRGESYGVLTSKLVSSYILDTEAGTLAEPKDIDLSQVRVIEPKGADVQGRFFGMRYEFTTPITLRWSGARLAASPRKG